MHQLSKPLNIITIVVGVNACPNSAIATTQNDMVTDREFTKNGGINPRDLKGDDATSMHGCIDQACFNTEITQPSLEYLGKR